MNGSEDHFALLERIEQLQEERDDAILDRDDWKARALEAERGLRESALMLKAYQKDLGRVREELDKAHADLERVISGV